MSKRLNLIFMGSHEFSCAILKALLQTKHKILSVYTQPPRPAGRKGELRKSPVHQLAEKEGLAVKTPLDFKDERNIVEFKNDKADLALVAAYGLILPPAILKAPQYGCINYHVSLLPKWRGASPIQHAILNGDKKTGLTIMQMDEGMDTGDILIQKSFPLGKEATSAYCFEQFGKIAANISKDLLENLEEYQKNKRPQNHNEASYAPKITRADGKINWEENADKIERRFRAFYPWPGIFTVFENENYKIHALKINEIENDKMPGTLLSKEGLIACGKGSTLQILSIQPPGKKAMAFEDFLRGRPHLKIGSVFA